MSKQTITKWWMWGGVVLLIAGVVLIPVSGLAVAAEIARNDSSSQRAQRC